jgi:serine protease Do
MSWRNSNQVSLTFIMPFSRLSMRHALACVLLLSAPGYAVAQTAARQAAAALPATSDLSSTLEATARLVAPAVVQIFATTYAPGSGVGPHNADLVTTQRSSGSGVIVDPAGYIVTNAHVVGSAQRLRVEIPVSGGSSVVSAASRSMPGQVIGIDPETDLAVVKIDGAKLPTIAFGDSEELQPGQLVMAFGSPMGLSNSVSLGVVSSVARQLEPESTMIYVQTDASINPGSSGGALVDIRGRLVGINTLNVTRGGGNDGLGFAAPSNIVRTVYEQIRTTGRVRRGDIGVRAQTLTPVLAAGLKLPRESGVVISDVWPNGPGAAVGLRPGDIVLSIDGKAVENSRQLQVNLYRRRVGETVQLEVLRDGQPLRVLVPMAERDERYGLGGAGDPRQSQIPRLGILAVALDARIAQMVPVMRTKTGVVVVSTVAGAVDSRDGGFAAGDVLISVNRTAVQDVATLRSMLDAMMPGTPVVVQLERRGQLLFLAFTIE